MRQILCPLSFVTLFAACAGADAPGEGATGSSELTEATAAEALCVQSSQKQRECQDLFLPALVDLRVRLDKPEGIAAMDKEQGRAALVEVAREEYKSDSTDEAISGMCSQISKKMADNKDAVAETRRCLEAKTCEEMVPCQIKVLENYHLKH